MDQTGSKIARNVILCRDGKITFDAAALICVSDSEIGESKLANLQQSQLEAFINYFVVCFEDETVLVDAGVGSAWGPDFGQSRQMLRSQFIEPENISKVFLTHVHHDHVLGLFDDDRAYYSNADLFVSRREAEALANGGAPRTSVLLWERILGTYGAGRVRLLDEGKAVGGMEICNLPGHSPGHSGYMCETQAGKAYLIGDVVHLENIQVENPYIGVKFDFSLSDAMASRVKALNISVDADAIIGGGHISNLSRVRREKNGFRLLSVSLAFNVLGDGLRDVFDPRDA